MYAFRTGMFVRACSNNASLRCEGHEGTTVVLVTDRNGRSVELRSSKCCQNEFVYKSSFVCHERKGLIIFRMKFG